MATLDRPGAKPAFSPTRRCRLCVSSRRRGHFLAPASKTGALAYAPLLFVLPVEAPWPLFRRAAHFGPKPALSPTRRCGLCFPSRPRGHFWTVAPNRRSRLRPVAVCASRRGTVATFGRRSPNRRSRLRPVAVRASRRGAAAVLGSRLEDGPRELTAHEKICMAIRCRCSMTRVVRVGMHSGKHEAEKPPCGA